MFVYTVLVVVAAELEGATGLLAARERGATRQRRWALALQLPRQPHRAASFRLSVQSSAALALLRTCFPLTAYRFSLPSTTTNTSNHPRALHLGTNMLPATLALFAALALGEYSIDCRRLTFLRIWYKGVQRMLPDMLIAKIEVVNAIEIREIIISAEEKNKLTFTSRCKSFF